MTKVIPRRAYSAPISLRGMEGFMEVLFVVFANEDDGSEFTKQLGKDNVGGFPSHLFETIDFDNLERPYVIEGRVKRFID